MKLPFSSKFIVGQPIPIRITLVSSHAWAVGPVDDDLQMIYDVLVDKENWLITGKKRGTFSVAVSTLTAPAWDHVRPPLMPSNSLLGISRGFRNFGHADTPATWTFTISEHCDATRTRPIVRRARITTPRTSKGGLLLRESSDRCGLSNRNSPCACPADPHAGSKRACGNAGRE